MCCKLSGSIPEFYVIFAEKSIGDLDVMYLQTDMIATFEETWQNSNLRDFNQVIQFFEVDNEEGVCPIGYVHLQFNGKLVYNWKTFTYEHEKETDLCRYLRNDDHTKEPEVTCSGPARVQPAKDSFVGDATLPTIDGVTAIRCLEWPPMAEEWKYRERKYAWPRFETVQQIVQNGCDLVPVAHRDHKNDPLQWRISFSRAEVVLIRSWSPTQQIVYHMLRYFLKKEIIRKLGNRAKDIICTYHLKTLMLWTCELKSPEWWVTNCVIDICSKLLKKLTVMIEEETCANYFILESNLFDNRVHRPTYSKILNLVHAYSDTYFLTGWFMTHYIRKLINNMKQTASVVYGETISDLDRSFRRIDDADHCEKLHEALQEFHIREIEMYSYWFNCIPVESHYFISSWNECVPKYLVSNNYQSESKRLLDLACVLLRLTWNSSCEAVKELSETQLLDIVSRILFKLLDHNSNIFLPKYSLPSCVSSSWWYFLKGKELASLCCRKKSDKYDLWIETCKRFFKYVLESSDEATTSI